MPALKAIGSRISGLKLEVRICLVNLVTFPLYVSLYGFVLAFLVALLLFLICIVFLRRKLYLIHRINKAEYGILFWHDKRELALIYARDGLGIMKINEIARRLASLYLITFSYEKPLPFIGLLFFFPEILIIPVYLTLKPEGVPVLLVVAFLIIALLTLFLKVGFVLEEFKKLIYLLEINRNIVVIERELKEKLTWLMNNLTTLSFFDRLKQVLK